MSKTRSYIISIGPLLTKDIRIDDPAPAKGEWGKIGGWTRRRLCWTGREADKRERRRDRKRLKNILEEKTLLGSCWLVITTFPLHRGYCSSLDIKQQTVR